MTHRILAHRHRLVNDENSRWWTLAAMCFALFMVMLDNTVVNVSLPSIQRDLHASLSALEWTINAYTLTLRRADGHRRAARRHLRPAPDVHVRRDRVRTLERGDRVRRQRHDAGRVPRGPGHRCRVHDAGDAVDHHPGVPARAAWHGDRHVGGRQRDGARDRTGARRLPHPAGELARDLLHQPADRGDRTRGDAVRNPRVTR